MMKLKNIMFVLSLAFVIQTATAQKKIEMNLKQCLDMALQNDQRVKTSEMEQTRLKYQKNQSIGAGLPQISASGTFQDYLKLPTQLLPGEIFNQPGTLIPVKFGTNYNMSGSIQVSQLIYNQSYLVSLQISKRMIEQGKLDLEKNRQSTIYDVAQLYYMAVSTDQQTKYLMETLKKLDTLTSITQVQLDKQMIKQVDFDRVNVNRTNLQTEVSNLNLMYTQQLNLIKYFTGLAPEDSVVLTTTVFDKKLLEVPVVNTENHISLREIDKQKELMNLQMGMVRSQCIPSLAAFGDFSSNSQQNVFGKLFSESKSWLGTSLVGLSLNVPIFSGTQRYFQLKQYKIQYQELNLNRYYVKKYLETGTRNALIKVQSLEQTTGSQNRNVTLADNVYKVIFDQYSQGYASLTDLLSAENDKIAAQSAYAQTLVQLRVAELDLYKSNGNLMDILK